MPFLTIAGENKLALNQSVNGGLNVVSFVLANIPNLGNEPSDRITSLPDSALIVDTLPFTKRGYVNPNQVVYSLVIGSNVGDYDFNWIGLIDDAGVLVAVSYVPTIQKRKNVGAVPGNTITRNFLLEYTGIQNITATTVAAETWQIDFTARLSGVDERERLANFDIYGHEGFLDDGWLVTGLAGTYSVAAGIGYVGGIRIKNTAIQDLTTTTFPNEIWLNVSLQGDISDMTAVGEFVIDTGQFEDYVDDNGIAHYLTKLAEIDVAGDVIDVRKLAYLKDVKSHQSKALFTVSGDENNIVLTSPDDVTKVNALNEFDEFSFIVAATNTDIMTVTIDGLAPMAISNIVDANQIYQGALVTLTHINGAFYLTEQVNPKTGHAVNDIGKLIVDTTEVLAHGEVVLDGSELSRSTHPILWAKISATLDGRLNGTSNLIDQTSKDADPITYGGYYGEGDGENTFTLPIVGGEFIRMFDDGRGVDAGRGFGSHKDATTIQVPRRSGGYFGAAWSDRLFTDAVSDENLVDVTSLNVSGNGSGEITNITALDTTRILRWDSRPRSIAYYAKTRL